MTANRARLPLLVTGGASGLGAAIVQLAHARGLRPVVLDRRPSDADVEHTIVDLRDRRAAERAVSEIAGRSGGLRAVITAAGIDACGTLLDVQPETWEDVIRVNLLGTAAVVRAALPALERSQGHVITVASTLGLRALSHATAYCASKFGVVGFTRALAAETAGRVGVTLLIPGGMHTAFFDGREARFKPPPEARLNQPQDVAAAALLALEQPPGCELREMVVCPSTESSWP